jgi:tetratricopeptide (TPR) repeat protein
LLRCAIADHPEDPYYYYKLSQEFGASVEGTTHLLQAAYLVLSKPVNEIKMLAYAPELLTAAALHWLQDGVINKSFYACQLALAHFPEHPATRLALGLTFLQSGDPGNARREIERALVTDPPLGGFYFDKMDWELSARTALARAMIQEGLPARAIDMLRSSRQFFPESEKVTHLLLEALLLIQKPLEALREGLRWLQHRADPQVLKYCADAAEALGDRNQAEEWRKKANGLV